MIADEPPPNKPETIESEPTDESRQLRAVNLVFLAALMLGLVSIWIFVGLNRIVAVPWLWAFGSLATGALIGLLFGIPRMRQTESNATGSETSRMANTAQPLINNNLIEISDWLTKIIVGLGLIELRQLPELIRRAATPLGVCLGGECGFPAAVAILIFFSVAGFLSGYINARTVIALIFRRSDDVLLRQLQKDVERTAAKQDAQELTTELKIRGVRTLISEPQSRAANPEAQGEQPPDELLRLARQYEKIQDRDYRARVARKDQIASELATYILSQRFPKDVLFGWVEANPGDGMIVALASYILAMPEEGDLGRLLRVAGRAQWLHAKFRITLAFRELFTGGYGTPEEWQHVLAVLEDYYAIARARSDAPLMSITSELANMIRNDPRSS